MDANGTDLPKASVGRDLVLAANGIRVVLAKRLAGAVWSMTWNTHEFVAPLMGNGGSQQSALSFDIPVGQGSEEENPTEAGNKDDNGGRTSSMWLEARGNGSTGFTRSKMAYYIPPGQVVESSPTKARARGIGVVSDVTLSKRISIGYKGFGNVVNYSLTFDIPSPKWFIQFEVLTGYMPRAFGSVYEFDGDKAVPATGKGSPGVRQRPLILAKNDTCALGIVCHTWPKEGRFKYPWYNADTENSSGHLPWDMGQYAPGTRVLLSKWNVVWHAGSPTRRDRIHQGKYTFGVALVLGTLGDVVRTLRGIT